MVLLMSRSKPDIGILRMETAVVEGSFGGYHLFFTLIPQHKFLQELQVSEKQSSQNTWICQKFHLS